MQVGYLNMNKHYFRRSSKRIDWTADLDNNERDEPDGSRFFWLQKPGSRSVYRKGEGFEQPYRDGYDV